MLRALLAVFALLMLNPVLAEDRRPIYGSLYAGGSEFDVDFEFAGTLNFDPEEDGDTIGLGVGYEINENWFIQLDYHHTDADDVDIDQVFVSINFRYPLFIDRMKGMVGLVAGEGSLEWNGQPEFADAIFDELDDDESLYGIQLGLNYDISRRWSINLTYQYFDQEFNTNLETPDDGRINFEHRDSQYLLFGLRFHL